MVEMATKCQSTFSCWGNGKGGGVKNTGEEEEGGRGKRNAHTNLGKICPFFKKTDFKNTMFFVPLTSLIVKSNGRCFLYSWKVAANKSCDPRQMHIFS